MRAGLLSAPEDPEDQRDYDRDDDAGHDREMKAEAFAHDVDVARQAAERQAAQPGPGQPGGEDQGAEDDEQALHADGAVGAQSSGNDLQ